MNQHEIILQLLDALVASRPLVGAHAQLFNDIRRMVAQHRDPSPVEWAALFAAYRDASDRLETVVRDLLEEHDLFEDEDVADDGERFVDEPTDDEPEPTSFN